MQLIDQYLKRYLFSEIHQVTINASPTAIFKVMRTVDFNESALFRVLFSLRGMPKGMHSIQGFIDNGLIELDVIVDQELVIGTIASLTGRGMLLLQRDEFVSFRDPGHIKGVTNYHLRPIASDQTLFSTETRFTGYGRLTKTSLLFYWVFIRFFSGVIRKEMLRLIKKEAEAIPADQQK